MELWGSATRLEVEYAIGMAWYVGGRICSGSSPQPHDSAQDAGPGWIDIAKIARNLGMGEEQVQEIWRALLAVLR